MAEELFIEVEDGEKVAVSHAGTDNERYLFVCHGFGGNKDRQKEYLELSEGNINVVTLSFRGNGDSDGEFIEQDLSSRIADLKAVVEHFDPETVYLFGTSFGGKVVFHAAEEIDPDAVIGKAPVTYNGIMDKFRDVIEEKDRFEYVEGKPIDERFFEDFDTYSFEDVIESIDFPVAIFHGGSDTTVHIENSFEAAKEMETDVMLQKLRDEKHSFSESGKKKLLGSMKSFLETV